MRPGGNQHVLYACAWHGGWEGLRWIWIIKQPMSPSPPTHEEQWVPPHIFLSKCQTPPSPSTSTGFPPILCNIMAIIPIMAQLGTPYSCRYRSISQLSEETLLLHKRHRQARYRGKPDILPHSLFSSKSENHLEKSNGNISHTFDLMVIQEAAPPLTGWHFALTFRKPILLYRGKKSQMLMLDT